MTMDEHPRGGWNLFARVLQEILTAHGYGLIPFAYTALKEHVLA